MNKRFFLTEQALLSGMIIDNRNIEKASFLDSADFYDSRHRAIFSKIKELHAAGNAIDLTSFAGGEHQDYVLELMELPAGLLNVDKYTEEIKNASLSRQLISNLKEIQAANGDDFSETKAKLFELARKLEQNTLIKFDFKAPSAVVARRTSFFLEDFIPLPIGAVTIISSRGGSGKSALALQVALRAAERQISTLAWLSEDPDYTTKYRLEKISQFTEIQVNNDYLRFSDQIPFQVLKKSDKQISVNPLFYEFKSACREFQIIILDPLIAFYGGDENNNGEARQFMDLLTEWAKRKNKSIVLIHHHAKFVNNNGDARGATAFIDAVRAHYTIEINKEDNKNIIIKIEKDNWGIKSFFKEDKIQIFKDNYSYHGHEKQY